MGTPPLPLVAAIGDPAGVGPELFLKAWVARREKGLAPFALIGSLSLMQAVTDRCGGAVRAVDTPAAVADVFGEALPVIDLGPMADTPGKPSQEGARLALHALETAAGLTIDGKASALVTGPIAKAALQDIGFPHPGQTEFCAAACGVAADDAVMMLAGPSLRVVPITVHVPLADVPSLLSIDLIVRRVRIAAAALQRDFGLAAPRIAIAGLNPHAGEQGRLGDEDIAIIAPAVEALRAKGLDTTGPTPGDAMFHAEARATYDLAVCMYHDQALIPLKALDFDRGVNVTLGLPIIRTSPDHGTAFALAGTGRASAGPTIAALRMAADCAGRRAT
ncbi:4-hydroxythreonine-4-phosphate dehydrogenase PdxA [Croceicoccus naphthovorans]|uniref:4-hydroxythreonine-4-phosphate dehydrogenase n=1 Tax=Croceicoccus naphthovorans TaxID=1348774 RepID=A0A0G3XFP4_9SPHN|nr:4-hydroxythreonine-4-phosphate dehydrogenase PdxA [Croceicoccus naphthovorans]AKM09178.1 4-hydroxythreonine-4-phosphate dehydrogenase [Croceicoccus naphthovorans]MBB3990452.1 4-hydroxythreonine-4-phosphate dehydrogenase [Croceicoccus naphthovorans]